VRTHDRPAQLMLNQVGVQKRPEIAAAEFAKSLSIELAAAVAFDAQLFGTAANNGQMIAEVQPGGPVAQQFVEMAAQLVGKGVARKARRPGLSLLEPLLTKFQKRAAS
jgi:pilus assembly protein CpaE